MCDHNDGIWEALAEQYLNNVFFRRKIDALIQKGSATAMAIYHQAANQANQAKAAS